MSIAAILITLWLSGFISGIALTMAIKQQRYPRWKESEFVDAFVQANRRGRL